LEGTEQSGLKQKEKAGYRYDAEPLDAPTKTLWRTVRLPIDSFSGQRSAIKVTFSTIEQIC
jgi:hypothetical protein